MSDIPAGPMPRIQGIASATAQKPSVRRARNTVSPTLAQSSMATAATVIV
jgi:hypothetical protein